MESLWIHEKLFINKRKLFANECYEILTGYFKTLDKKLSRRCFNILYKIFDNTMKNIYHQGPIIHNNQLNSLMNIFDTNDEELILGYIENVFNRE